MTMNNLIPVFVLIAALQAKHFICDGPLQTKAMVISKSKYGDRLGLVHALLHGIGTLAVLAVAGFNFNVVLALAVLDFALHYHIDYLKENLVRQAGLTVQDAKFWWALSADQTLHQLTYLAIAYLAVTA
jgi:Protein of unknown function (DUF3307)